MQIDSENDEIRVTPEEARQLLNPTSLESADFIENIRQVLDRRLPEIERGEITNFYISIEVFNY